MIPRYQDLNLQDNNGNTYLHFAIGALNISIIRRLLIEGADKNLQNNQGLTPIDQAITSSQEDVINIIQ